MSLIFPSQNYLLHHGGRMSKDSHLYHLQLIDSEIDKLNIRCNSIPEQQELFDLEEKIIKLTELINKEKDLLNKAELGQKQLEDELGMLTVKIKREEGRLYGGEVSNPKELKSLQSEVRVLKDKRDSQEDELLALIEEVEKLRDELSKLNKAEVDFNKKADNLRAKVLSLTVEITASIENEEQKKREITAKIDAGLLELYQKLRREKRGVAVAKISGLTCLGCHMEMA